MYISFSPALSFSFFADKLIHRPTHSLTHTQFAYLSFLPFFFYSLFFFLLFIACFLPNDDIAAVATEAAAAAELLTGLQIDRQAITPVHWAYNGQILQQGAAMWIG